MTRATSLEAYHDLIETGDMTRMEKVVYDAILAHGPLTAGELQVKVIGLNTNLMKTTVRRRMTDLYDRGWITTTGKRQCTETGRNSMLWIARTEAKPPKVHHCKECGQKISRNIGGLARKAAIEAVTEVKEIPANQKPTGAVQLSLL